MAPPKLRILMLCGYTQNQHIFSARLGAVRKHVAPIADMVFVDPPHIVDMPTFTSSDFDSTAEANPTTPETTARTWWYTHTDDSDQLRIQKWDETVLYLRKILVEQGPFDGVLGFSQGAATAGLLTALLERPTLHPLFASAATVEEGNRWPHPPLKFCIIAAGMVPSDSEFGSYYKEKIFTPSMHIIGNGDTIITPATAPSAKALRTQEYFYTNDYLHPMPSPKERSNFLASKFNLPRIESHEGGHHVPSKGNFRPIYTDFLSGFLEKEGGTGAAEANGKL